MFTPASLRGALRAFVRARRGNIALIAAAAIPAVLGCAGVALDLVNGERARQGLQAAADGAALAAASELRLRSTNQSTVSAVVNGYVTSNAPQNAQVSSIGAAILDNRAGVRVSLSARLGSVFGNLFQTAGYVTEVSAVARLSGGAPLCALALEQRQGRAIFLQQQARITAPDCAIISNSSSPRGITALDSSELTAAMICSGGGFEGRGANFAPDPTTDCPAIPDPLANREEPAAAGCTRGPALAVTGTRRLNPGVYCGGISVLPGATVTLSPGIYVMKNGPLLVANNASLEGDYVGFYFVGDLSTMTLAARSRIRLSAPRDGAMAGFLFFANRVLLTGDLNLRRFRIESDDARTLLGTIYLRDGVLEVASRRPIADRSAYTVIVARRIEVSAGPDLVLNTDYDGTDVLVPDGVGPRLPQAYLAD